MSTTTCNYSIEILDGKGQVYESKKDSANAVLVPIPCPGGQGAAYKVRLHNRSSDKRCNAILDD